MCVCVFFFFCLGGGGVAGTGTLDSAGFGSELRSLLGAFDGFRVSGFGCRVLGLGFRVLGFGF